MWRFSGPEFHISKLKIYHEKTQMEGKVRKNAQFFVGGQRRNSMFSWQPASAWPVLKWNQVAKFLKNFEVYFVLYTQENDIFKKEIYAFVNIFIRYIHFEISLGPPIWDLCWILPLLILLAWMDPQASQCYGYCS